MKIYKIDGEHLFLISKSGLLSNEKLKIGSILKYRSLYLMIVLNDLYLMYCNKHVSVFVTK